MRESRVGRREGSFGRSGRGNDVSQKRVYTVYTSSARGFATGMNLLLNAALDNPAIDQILLLNAGKTAEDVTWEACGK